MATINQLNFNSTDYDIEDTTARQAVEEVKNGVGEVKTLTVRIAAITSSSWNRHGVGTVNLDKGIYYATTTSPFCVPSTAGTMHSYSIPGVQIIGHGDRGFSPGVMRVPPTTEIMFKVTNAGEKSIAISIYGAHEAGDLTINIIKLANL